MDHICGSILAVRPAVLVALCIFALACSKADRPIAEALPPAAPIVEPGQRTEISKLPPAELKQVDEAVRRVFKDSVLIDTSRKPAFVAGDFNGDSSEDIAVVLKPNPERLAELNAEFPAWMLRDLSESKQIPRLGVAPDDALLAVIHGFGSSGWRDPEATQTYLLKNAVGSGMEAQAARNVVAATRGRKRPTLRGEVVAEVLDSNPGYVYFGHSTYSWYDPKTFSGEPEPQRGHGAPEQRVKK